MGGYEVVDGRDWEDGPGYVKFEGGYTPEDVAYVEGAGYEPVDQFCLGSISAVVVCVVDVKMSVVILVSECREGQGGCW